jgi:polyisoprenoid-binding protein YceI
VENAVKEIVVLLGLCGLVLAGALNPAQGADWKMDPAGSKLEFIATFEKTAAPGVFKEFDARLRFDAEKPAGGSLDVTIKVTSADMSIADVNKEIRGKDWFDYAGFPQAEFRSTDLRRKEGNHYVARGTLSLKGVKQPVEVPFTWTGSTDGATMEGELTLKRGAFGIGSGEWAASNVIGADVKVKFKVKLRKAG